MQRRSSSDRERSGLSKVYRWASGAVVFVAVAYLLLLNFPQALFAHSANYEHFTIHSQDALDANIGQVLEKAEALLKRSPIYDESVERRVYLTSSFGMYGLLSHKAFRSFANSVPLIDNIIINKSDIAADRVFVDREQNNSRSLSGVIAHETTHLFIRRRYGTLAASMMPTWKNEGYCEYIAGDSTISLDDGIKLWLADPSDDTGYRYVKYHAMVKYLLEKEGMTVDDFFTQSLDEKTIAAKTLASYQ